MHTVVYIIRFDKKMYRMINMNAEDGVDFLEDLTPLSEALISVPIQLPSAYVDLLRISLLSVLSYALKGLIFGF